MIGGYIADLTIVAVLVVGITALMGVITNGVGERVFGGKKRTEFTDRVSSYQTNWKQVGGNRK
ncbi:hypothetical protein J2Y67_003268 [Neobacillus niacini]|nr:hypothetical protein [Neobacillus niacini]MDR7000798.1 hypothetical protein [Neobacillus niacini]